MFTLISYPDVYSLCETSGQVRSVGRSDWLMNNISICEKNRMTNHKPDTIFFTSEENRIGFSRQHQE